MYMKWVSPIARPISMEPKRSIIKGLLYNATKSETDVMRKPASCIYVKNKSASKMRFRPG